LTPKGTTVCLKEHSGVSIPWGGESVIQEGKLFVRALYSEKSFWRAGDELIVLGGGTSLGNSATPYERKGVLKRKETGLGGGSEEALVRVP